MNDAPTIKHVTLDLTLDEYIILQVVLHEAVNARREARDTFIGMGLDGLADAVGEFGNAALRIAERTLDWGAWPRVEVEQEPPLEGRFAGLDTGTEF